MNTGGGVRVHAAPVPRGSSITAAVRRLTVDALDPGPALARLDLVRVEVVDREVWVELLEPLASFARERGCRTVRAHVRENGDAAVVAVVLVRHPQPVLRAA
ncbi:hypothetical protein [Phycicoccus flavus]|uniref:hypothetical protein n=1 Tax=Phycicoccus flavus TaxID=2502783 RepID=UPI000FEBE33C|nr:hypothetical protein [Phycicoccus flavus]NHA67709.1 hypothetical protein [Phycicoccus flavus]